MKKETYLEKASERAGLLMRALKHRNYRLFFGSQTLSSMQQVAMGRLVSRLTGSALLSEAPVRRARRQDQA